ncbi:MAG: oxygenase MpaB family protein, partial [Gaiellaceae bacterium]
EARLPPPLRLIGPAHRLSTAALLPTRLREDYGLGWSRAHAAALGLAAGSLRLAATPLFLAGTRLPSAAGYAA